uniref:Uncharacterized protein n=1 Tax=viral metagenome TaxID=1070528 RepID=A0A6C0AP79_9ZZZZ
MVILTRFNFPTDFCPPAESTNRSSGGPVINSLGGGRTKECSFPPPLIPFQISSIGL